MCQINIVVCDVHIIPGVLIICMCECTYYLSVTEMCQVCAIDLPCVDWKKWLVVSPECPSEFGHILQPIIICMSGHTSSSGQYYTTQQKVAS